MYLLRDFLAPRFQDSCTAIILAGVCARYPAGEDEALSLVRVLEQMGTSTKQEPSIEVSYTCWCICHAGQCE